MSWPRLAAVAVWLAMPVAVTAEPIILRGSVHAAKTGVSPPARVEIVPMKGNFDWARGVLEEQLDGDVVGWVETGRDGRFAIEVPEVGVWRLRVRASGFVPMRYFPLPVTHSMHLPPILLLPGVEVRVVARAPMDRSTVWVYAASENSAMWSEIATDGWRTGPRFGRLDDRGKWAVPRAEGEVLELSMFHRGAPVPSRALSQGTAVATIPAVEETRERWIGVRDQDGSPVVGVVVAGELAWPIGRTDEAGRLKLTGAFSKPIGLELFGEGSRQKVVLEPPGPDAGETAWFVLAEPVTVAGQVLDAARKEPMAGALVWPGHDPGSYTRTNDAGRFEISFPSGDRYWIQAQAPGYLPRLQRFETTTEPPPLRLALRKAVEIRGRVVDGHGTPIAGVSVAARTENHPPSEAYFHPDRAWDRSISDLEGRFQLGDLDPGRQYHLQARGDGLRPAQAEAGKPSARREVRLVVERTRPAYGRVVDSQERALVGATVELQAVSSPQAPSVLRGSWSAETGPNGIFHLSDLPARRLDIEAGKTGFAKLKVRGVEVPPGTGPIDLGTLSLEPGTAIHGQVVDLEGEAVADVGVWMIEDTGQSVILENLRLQEQDPAALSDGDGAFRLADLERGRKVHLLFDREGYLTASRMGIVAPNEEPLEVELTPASRVSGRVVDEDGEPIARAAVALSAKHRSADSIDLEYRKPHGARSDGEGRFVIDKLVPGPATVTVFARGFRSPPPHELEVPAGTLEDLIFILERGAVLTGMVTNAGGEAVQGARLSIGRPYAISEADGSYRLAGLSLGPQRLDVDHGAYNPAARELEIEPGTHTVDVVLEGGFRVTGSVVDTAGGPVANADVSLRLRTLTASRSYEARAGDDGRFSIERAAEGSYDVEARKRGYASVEIFDAFEVAGAPVDDLRIVLRAGASVVGHVLGLTFEELAAVQVEARRSGQQSRKGAVTYDGRYEVADLSAGDWQLLARIPGRGRQAEAWVTIEQGLDRLVRDLEFDGGLALQGRVTHRGQSLAGAEVSLIGLDVATRRTVMTGRQGGFRFDDLQAGSYRLDAVHRAELLVHGEELELFSDRTVDIDIWTAAARGTVTSAAGAGAPLAGAVVSLQRFGPASGDLEGPLFTAGTESDGRFQMLRLGKGSYRVIVRKTGFLPAEDTVEVFPGVDLDGLDFALTPADGLDVVLQLASGRRVPTASVHVFDGAGQLVQTEIQPVAEDGLVRFSVAAGSWAVLVSAPGAVARRLVVTVPSEAQAVVLQESALLRIRVPALMESNRTGTLTLSGPDGRLVESVDASGTLRRNWRVPGGVASIDGVPAGIWTLELVADGQTWRQTATLTAGLESEFTLQ